MEIKQIQIVLMMPLVILITQQILAWFLILKDKLWSMERLN